MLRTIFVLALTAFGVAKALQGPFYALLFYVWFAYFRPDQWVWNTSLLLALKLSLVSGIYFVVRALPSVGKGGMDLRTLTLAAIVATSCISALLSDHPLAWERWQEFGKVLIVAYMMYCVLCDDIKHVRITMIVMALSLGFEAAKQGYVGLLLRPGGANINELAQLGDNNGVAVGMVMLASLFVALSRTTENKRERWLYHFFTIGIVYRAITTYSRGGFLSIATLAAVYIARSKHKLKAMIGVVLVAGVILPVLPPEFWGRMATMNVRSEDEMDTSAASRLHFWRVAVLMANDKPAFGVGFNTYNQHFDGYDFSNGFYGRRRSVHSMWFGVLAELGYVGLVLFVLMFALALLGMRRVARLARDGSLPTEYYHYAIGLQAALLACIVGGSFLPWQYTEMLWHFFALSMALRKIALNNAKAPASPAAVSYLPRTA